MDHPHPLIKILSGSLVGTLLAAVVIGVSSMIALSWSYSTLGDNQDGTLVSKPVFAGLSVPAIYVLVCGLACLAPVIGIILQMKPRFPMLARKLSIVLMASLTLLAVWWAGESTYRYLGELLWMYHD